MLSKSKIKLINSLRLKKYRDSENLFIVESNKLANEVLRSSFNIRFVVATSKWLQKNQIDSKHELIEVSEQEFKKVSSQTTPQQILIVLDKPELSLNIDELDKELFFVLDDIQDPGNLGTIIRLADWYGMKHIVCSHETTDVYNHKTIQSTMGAFLRTKVHYVDLVDFLEQLENTPIYGTFMDGENVHKTNLTHNGAIILGNEGNGISGKLSHHINKRISIPKIGTEGPESLNVAIAAAIVVSEFRRS